MAWNKNLLFDRRFFTKKSSKFTVYHIQLTPNAIKFRDLITPFEYKIFFKITFEQKNPIEKTKTQRDRTKSGMGGPTYTWRPQLLKKKRNKFTLVLVYRWPPPFLEFWMRMATIVVAELCIVKHELCKECYYKSHAFENEVYQFT